MGLFLEGRGWHFVPVGWRGRIWGLPPLGVIPCLFPSGSMETWSVTWGSLESLGLLLLFQGNGESLDIPVPREGSEASPGVLGRGCDPRAVPMWREALNPSQVISKEFFLWKTGKMGCHWDGRCGTGSLLPSLALLRPDQLWFFSPENTPGFLKGWNLGALGRENPFPDLFSLENGAL